MNRIKYTFLAFAVSLCLCAAAAAQQPTGTISGVVTDPNGAVISGASVTATNKATNLTRTVTTNDEGVYVLANLPVGEYDVKVEATNFETKISEIPLIDTQESKADEVIESKEIENLPLNGRNFLELALLTPGNALTNILGVSNTNYSGFGNASVRRASVSL